MKEIDELIQQLNIQIEAEENQEYQGLQLLIEDIKITLGQASDQKQHLMSKYTPKLDKLISKLHSNVLAVAQISLNPVLTNFNTTTIEARSFLKELLDQVNVIKQIGADNNKYQATMGFIINRFD
jgi:hypothetical protein